MRSPKLVQVGSLLSGLYLTIVWACVYHFLGGFHPLAFAIGLSLCGLAVFAVALLVSRVLNHQTAKDPAGTAAGDGSGRQVYESARELLALANRRLSESPKVSSERVRTKVNQLPLYIVLGLEGSGKTSTFVNSGLEPELLAGRVFQENQIIPTSPCNFWLTQGAVFVEIAGRVLSGDPHDFVRLVKLLRPGGIPISRRLWASRRPHNLRGVVLCCDLAPFLGAPNPVEQAGQNRLFQERLRQIGEVFGADFPVYVVFTKTDRIKHFAEHFARLTTGEHRQLLGCGSLSQAQERYSEESEGKRLAGSINTLYYSLAEKRRTLLAREPDLTARLHAYEFPREFKRYRGLLAQFLAEVFRPNPLQPGPLLRGFYFTGVRHVAPEEPGTGQANPGGIDNSTQVLDKEKVAQFLGQLSQKPANAVPRWAFAWELFSLAILGDSASGRPYGNRRLDWYRVTGFGVGAAALAVFGVLAIRSWVKTDHLLTDLRNTASQLPVVRADEVPGRLVTMEHLRVFIQTLRNYSESGPPWLSVWLYPGAELAEPVRSFYFRRFKPYFLTDTANQFVTRLKTVPDVPTPAVGYENVYGQLKGYLSITTKACEPDAALLTGVWRNNRQIEKDLPHRQFAFFIQERMPIPLLADDNALSQGRGYLNKFDPAEGIYRSLLDQVSKGTKPARLADYTQHGNVLKGETEVRAPFTREGAKAILERIAQEKLGRDSCVFEKDAHAGINDDQLRQRLLDMYLRDYIEAWRKYLGSLAVVPYGGPKDAAAKLGVLTENDSAILAALYMASEHTTFPGEPSADGRKTLADITKLFQSAHKLFLGDATRTRFIGGQNQPYLDSLRALQQTLDRLAQSNNSQEANLEAAKAYRSGLDTVKSISYTFDLTDVTKDVQRFLEDPIRNARNLFTEDFAKAERDRLQAGVNKLCQEAGVLQKKRPFNPRAQEEATETDASRFFAFRGGELWKFKQAYLESLIVKRDGRWVQSTEGGQAQVTLNPQFLTYFNRLSSISDALFPPDGARPGMEYTLKADKPENVSALSLDAGNGEVPAGQYTFKWPANKFLVKVSPGSPMADFDGLWSLFYMTSRATNKGGGLFELSCVFSLGAGDRCNKNTGTDGKDVIVQIHVVKPPNGVEHSLDKGFLEVGGGCPAALAPSGIR